MAQRTATEQQCFDVTMAQLFVLFRKYVTAEEAAGFYAKMAAGTSANDIFEEVIALIEQRQRLHQMPAEGVH